MTYKQSLIIDYLSKHNGLGITNDIFENVQSFFLNEDELNSNLTHLVSSDLLAKDKNSSLYILWNANLQILYTIPHVLLYKNEDNTICLRIEDYELFDAFSDLIFEDYNIEFEYIICKEQNKMTITTAYFSNNVNIIKLTKAVRSMEIEEVERIFKINNAYSSY